MVEGTSIREASRVFGLHRDTVRKMLAYSVPTGCRRQNLPHSDGRFVKAYPAEITEAFCDGHVSAFAFPRGVPQTILYDNTRRPHQGLGGKTPLAVQQNLPAN